jgi:hypothetical protein
MVIKMVDGVINIGLTIGELEFLIELVENDLSLIYDGCFDGDEDNDKLTMFKEELLGKLQSIVVKA